MHKRNGDAPRNTRERQNRPGEIARPTEERSTSGKKPADSHDAYCSPTRVRHVLSCLPNLTVAALTVKQFVVLRPWLLIHAYPFASGVIAKIAAKSTTSAASLKFTAVGGMPLISLSFSSFYRRQGHRDVAHSVQPDWTVRNSYENLQLSGLTARDATCANRWRKYPGAGFPICQTALMSDIPRHDAPQPDDVRHTLTVRDVERVLAEAGVQRSHRHVLRLCQSGMLDAVTIPGVRVPMIADGHSD